MNTVRSLGKTVGNKLYYNNEKDNSFITKIVTEQTYTTTNENLILIKGIDKCELYLDSLKTSHIIIKSLTDVIIKPTSNLIDEFFTEIEMGRGACVELFNLDNNWYIISSDGLKLD